MLGVMTEQLARAPVSTVKQVKLSESFARPCWGQSLLARTTWATTSTAAVGNSDHSSYVHGAYEQTLLGRTIGDNFRVMAESLPDNLAIASLHQQVWL